MRLAASVPRHMVSEIFLAVPTALPRARSLLTR